MEFRNPYDPEQYIELIGNDYISILDENDAAPSFDLSGIEELDWMINSLQTVRQAILNETTQTTLNQEEMK